MNEAVVANTISDRVWDAFSILLIFTLMIDVLYPKLSIISRWQVYRNYKTNYVVQEPRQLTVSDRDIKLSSESFTAIIDRVEIDKVLENNNILLLLTKREKEKIIIPKTVFSKDNSLEKFRGIIKYKIK